MSESLYLDIGSYQFVRPPHIAVDSGIVMVRGRGLTGDWRTTSYGHWLPRAQATLFPISSLVHCFGLDKSHPENKYSRFIKDFLFLIFISCLIQQNLIFWNRVLGHLVIWCDDYQIISIVCGMLNNFLSKKYLIFS